MPRWRVRWKQFVELVWQRIPQGVLGAWRLFLGLMGKRLQAGHLEYGDGSFDLELSRLLEEVEEEVLDQVGWSYVQWDKIQTLKKQVIVLEERIAARKRYLAYLDDAKIAADRDRETESPPG